MNINTIIDIRDINYRDGEGFVADPFLAKNGDTYLFFEVFYREPREKLICCAKITESLDAEYLGVAIQDSTYEFSFPYTFKFESEWYMIPEITSTNKPETPLKLYRATDFPLEWSTESEFDVYGVDPVVFNWHNNWWLICRNKGDFLIYHSEDPTLGNWSEHTFNSKTRNTPNRMAGRPVISGDNLYLMYQDGIHYGERVRCFEVTELDQTTFEQKEVEDSPILHGQYTRGWNHLGMHHVDFNWEDGYAIVDGHNSSGWKIGMVNLNTRSPPPARLTPAPEQFSLNQSLIRRWIKNKNRGKILKMSYNYWQKQGTKEFFYKVQNKLLNRG